MRVSVRITGLLLAVNLCCGPLRAQDPSCCQHAAAVDNCKEACDQLASIKSESHLKHFLQRLPSFCPESMSELWVCINSSLPGVSRKSAGWVGIGCCELAISTECLNECKYASSRKDITEVCKKLTENSLYSCITKNEKGSSCCLSAGRHTICRQYCEAIFSMDSTPSQSQIQAVTGYCQSHSQKLVDCVVNFTESYPDHSPTDNLYCCERAEAAHCQLACQRILSTMKTEQEIIDGLINECGSPLPQDPMWQCFLGSALPPLPPEEETPHPAKMDGAKLHCCSKANSSLCRDMCQKISLHWDSQTWQDFEQFCEYKPAETELISCLSDVREPCQLGCKDLTYCTNFNNRPTELFRSCNIQSDQGAMNDIKLWSNGTIKMPFMNIPVLDIRKCLPNMWKAVACSLQIKPCHSKSRGSLICKSDCVSILTQCGDSQRFHEGQTAERICDLLSPIDDPERCIPLHKYLTPSSIGSTVHQEVIHTCNPNPCPSNYLCQVNRMGCLDEDDCEPFLCVPGCKLGEASEFLVPRNFRVQVPTSLPGCYEVCSCGASGRLENCMEMRCENIESPLVAEGQNNLPCSCADHFIPVCAANGRTYPSACVARCMGFQDHQFVFGQCHLSDPCSGRSCPRKQRCVPKHRVCLSDSSDCVQFECVGRPASCNYDRLQPVCDTHHLMHPSMCHLQQTDNTLAYVGHCQEACRKQQEVCGHNGETYNTPCHAFSDRVAVDYEGPCRAVGVVPEVIHDSACSLVSCPPVSTPGCYPITPPGACCPICASMLQIHWNKEKMNCFSEVNKNQPVTVHDVLQILRLHVSVPQCDVFGYLSIDHQLVVLIVPVDQQPTPLQVEACGKEAEKIESLINYASPTLVSHVPLSAFLESYIRTSSMHSRGVLRSPPPSGLGLLLLLLLPAALGLQQI
ncbi:Reversion-inducing cysteine-rich protein with Kazal motifs [Oryzias melastigma]|uniref:Reversion-inducing cysteine-rich protein with Kazal motifs n=1 Tax=Oryzias melastigma TaxID=30732 RepID=A0A3B3BT35_ORYME|nr:reversion-inducing cysteine-rich protein with Kazal motifs [Oryzias melastigma]KAF6735937.1 Reversion-inducing cysteine-rich protein with Kazal motifs [Oryzias melastigma]